MFLVSFFLFRNKDGESTSALDIQYLDTYYIIGKSHFLITLGTLMTFAIYIVRMLNEKFTNNTVNIILILSTIGLILNISKIYAGYRLMEHLSNHENIEESTVHTYQDNKEYKILAFFWLTVQALLMVLIAYTGYRTGQNNDPTTLDSAPIR